MTRAAVVLVAMRVDAPARHRELLELTHAIGAELAYLQLGSPGLHDVLDRLAHDDVTTVRLVRAPGDHGTPGRSWLGRVAADWARGHPDVTVEVADRVVRDDAEPLRSPAWEQLPGFRHHVLVCRGPRCTARGAEATALRLGVEVRAGGLGDDDVLLTQTGCLYPCNHAPVVAVQPDDVWYGRVDAEVVGAIVGDHLVAGIPVREHRLPRSSVQD